MQTAAPEIDTPNASQKLVEQPPKRGPGRPAMITLALIQQVGQLIAKGLTEEQACLRVGINLASFRTARSRNPEFEAAIKQAKADFLDQAIDTIAKGGRGWQGLAWLLERRHGDQFRRNTGMEVTGLITAFNPVDVLLRKPLQQWTEADIQQSIGAWKLIKKWSPDQLHELLALYDRVWGPMRDCTDEQLEWIVEVEKAMDQQAIRQGETVECELVGGGSVAGLPLELAGAAAE